MGTLSNSFCASAAAVVLALSSPWAAADPVLPVSNPFEYRFISSMNADLSFGSTPAVGWQNINFDDSAWSRAANAYPAPLSPTIPIAVPSGCSNCLPAGYIWHDPNRVSDGTTGVPSAYFHRSFTMPSLVGDAFPFDAILQVVADDDFEVWLNGTLVLANDDFGTANDRGPDYVHTMDVTSLLRLDPLGGFAQNVLAIHATDGALRNPSDVGFEHLAYQLRIRTVPEPASALLVGLALAGLAWLSPGRKDRAV